MNTKWLHIHTALLVIDPTLSPAVMASGLVSRVTTPPGGVRPFLNAEPSPVVFLATQVGADGRVYAQLFYPSLRHISPELHRTPNIQVVQVRWTVSTARRGSRGAEITL